MTRRSDVRRHDRYEQMQVPRKLQAPAGRADVIILMTFAALLLRLGWGPQLLRYVAPGSRWHVALAAIVIASVCVCQVAAGLRPGNQLRGAAGHTRDGVGAPAAWLLLLPVCVMSIVPPALGPSAARGQAVNATRPASGFRPLPRSGSIRLTVGELVLRTVWENDRGLAGRRLEIIGFVERRDATGFLLARFVITCCAADARPYGVMVRYPGLIPRVGQWVKVSGRLIAKVPGRGSAAEVVPDLLAAQVSIVAQPDDPYE